MTFAEQGNHKAFMPPNAVERDLTIRRVLEYLTKSKLIPLLRRAVVEDEAAWAKEIEQVLMKYVTALKGMFVMRDECWLKGRLTCKFFQENSVL